METYHLGDRGDSENVHELDAKKLKERTVVNIDIANDPVDTNDYKKDEDPTIYKSEKTGRGPLSGDWKGQFWEGVMVNFLLTKIFSAEFCWSSDDRLQAGDSTVQVVGTSDKGREFHSYNTKKIIHKLPQTGDCILIQNHYLIIE